jgi:hypothetical protein
VSRETSTRFRAAAYAQETGECPLLLLTISHADLDEPIRVVHNGEDIVSRGNTYLAAAFEFVIPDEKESQPPAARLAICNVDRRIVQAIRGLATPPKITAEIVLADTPNTVEALYEDLVLQNASYDVLIVEGTLGYEDFFAESFPGDTFTPGIFPGVFGSVEER